MKEDQKNKIPEDILKQLLSVDPETVYASGYASWQEGDYSRAVIDFSWLCGEVINSGRSSCI